MNCERCNNKIHFENDYGYACDKCMSWNYKKNDKCCSNPMEVFIQLEYQNGVRHQRKACENCKEIFSKSYLKDSNFNTYKYCSYDKWQVLKESKYEMKNKLIQELTEYVNELKENRKKHFDELHSQHLQSNEWKAIRRMVIEREKNLCQGCRKAPIQEIHHDTYVHLGEEFLFQLIGLCHNCHSRFHNKNND